MRSGRMRWTVEDQTLDAEPGDVIVTPAGTAHAYEVLGDSRRALSASTRPRVPSPSHSRRRQIVGLGSSLARSHIEKS
jgi:quercetin dioxygenase-like cupin family protein